MEQEGYGVDPAPIADTLLIDLNYNSGIVRGSTEQGYFFLHPTMQEFLAAAALSRLVHDPKGNGWESEIEVEHEQWTVHKLVDKKAWDPRRQEVITLFARQLQNPGPLLDMLSHPNSTSTNPHGDDLFRHRLALAVLCLPEIPSEIRNPK